DAGEGADVDGAGAGRVGVKEAIAVLRLRQAAGLSVGGEGGLAVLAGRGVDEGVGPRRAVAAKLDVDPRPPTAASGAAIWIEADSCVVDRAALGQIGRRARSGTALPGIV
ncbi:MAG TPA: hypothetical protein VII38_23140, partial [Polyangia bacterium]